MRYYNGDAMQSSRGLLCVPTGSAYDDKGGRVSARTVLRLEMHRSLLVFSCGLNRLALGLCCIDAVRQPSLFQTCVSTQRGWQRSVSRQRKDLHRYQALPALEKLLLLEEVGLVEFYSRT